MTDITIVEEEAISLSELKNELSKIKKRDGELNFRAARTEDYLNKFSTLKLKDIKALKKDIAGLDLPRIKDIHIVKIIDMMPSTEQEMKFILGAFNLTLSKDNLAKLFEVFKKYL